MRDALKNAFFCIVLGLFTVSWGIPVTGYTIAQDNDNRTLRLCTFSSNATKVIASDAYIRHEVHPAFFRGDGKKIAYLALPSDQQPTVIKIMNNDGSGVQTYSGIACI